MEESKTITLGLGDVSLNERLGCYYIDMRPALVHYRPQNIYGGKFDDNGVPLCGALGGGYYYSPTNIAQYGFMVHADWLENPDESKRALLRHCLAVLESLKTEQDGYCVWYHHHYAAKYNINPPWASAMAQGEVISFYLRMYQTENDDHLLAVARKAYGYLKLDYKEGGVRRYDDEGNLWFEEFPSDPPSFVLNGFIYTLFGLYDLYRVTKDKEVWNEIQLCLKTLRENLHRYDAGYWSYYDLLKKELVRYYYQKNVHVPQLEVLYKLTGEEIFAKYKTKWAATVNAPNFVFVKLMYRIWPRWQNLMKKWKK